MLSLTPSRRQSTQRVHGCVTRALTLALPLIGRFMRSSLKTEQNVPYFHHFLNWFKRSTLYIECSHHQLLCTADTDATDRHARMLHGTFLSAASDPEQIKARLPARPVRSRSCGAAVTAPRTNRHARRVVTTISRHIACTDVTSRDNSEARD